MTTTHKTELKIHRNQFGSQAPPGPVWGAKAFPHADHLAALVAGLFKKGLGREGKRRKEEEREGKGVRGREKRREGLTRMNNFISGLEIKSSICIFSDSEIYTNNTKNLFCYVTASTDTWLTEDSATQSGTVWDIVFGECCHLVLLSQFATHFLAQMAYTLDLKKFNYRIRDKIPWHFLVSQTSVHPAYSMQKSFEQIFS